MAWLRFPEAPLGVQSGGMGRRGDRFLSEVRPGHWVVQCNRCPRREGKRSFDSKDECDAWWKDHLATALHQRRASPEERHARKVELGLMHRIFNTSGIK